MNRLRITPVHAIAVVTLLVGAAACGDDDDTPASGSPATAAADTIEPTTEAAAATSPDTAAPDTAAPTTAPPDASDPASTDAPAVAETIEITATDYAFSGVPESIDPGTKLTLTNSSTVEVHEFVALSIPDGETRPAAEIVADGAALGGLFGGGPPAAVVVAAPGSSTPGAVVGDGTLTRPGRYLLICTIPTGADPEAYLAAAAASGGGPPDVAGGPPHFVHGMLAEVVVSE